MLDELINSSFDLDYDLFSCINGKFKKYSSNIESPTIKSNDLLREFENYINITRAIFTELLNFLTKVDDQRKNFRMILIKMSKDKLLIEKLFQEEDSLLVLNKLRIHDELKSYIIDRDITKLLQKEAVINELNEQIEHYASTCTCVNNISSFDVVSRENHKRAKFSSMVSNSKSTKMGTIENSFNGSSLSIITKNATKVNLINQQREKNNTSYNMNGSSTTTELLNKQKFNENVNMKMKNIINDNIPSHNTTINDSYGDSVWKKMLSDFHTDKLNIISNSPIQTPRSKSKRSDNHLSKFNNNNKHNTKLNINNPSTLKFQTNGCMSSSVSNTPRMNLNTMREIDTGGINYQYSKKNVTNVDTKPKRYSKSIDFDSSFDYMHYQTQENMQVKNFYLGQEREDDEYEQEEGNNYENENNNYLNTTDKNANSNSNALFKHYNPNEKKMRNNIGNYNTNGNTIPSSVAQTPKSPKKKGNTTLTNNNNESNAQGIIKNQLSFNNKNKIGPTNNRKPSTNKNKHSFSTSIEKNNNAINTAGRCSIPNTPMQQSKKSVLKSITTLNKDYAIPNSNTSIKNSNYKSRLSLNNNQVKKK
jgi:hypothetical protein